MSPQCVYGLVLSETAVMRNSLFLHGLLVAAAGGSQLLVHISAAPDASKATPIVRVDVAGSTPPIVSIAF